MSLFHATRELHHACENHAVGQAMVNGSIKPIEWAHWLKAMQVLHRDIDWILPEHMCREALFQADLSVLPEPCQPEAVEGFCFEFYAEEDADSFGEQDALLGVAYVLHGAHLSGGRVLAPKMAKRGFPSVHTCYREPGHVRTWLTDLRDRVELAPYASATFQVLLKTMDEIEVAYA